MSILLIFEIFMLDTFIDGMVDKIDNNLLKTTNKFLYRNKTCIPWI